MISGCGHARRRHRHRAGRHDGRDQQHRRRGPAGAGRLHHLRAARGLRRDRRHRHPDRRRGRRAGQRLRRADGQRRRARRAGRGLRAAHRRAGVAAAAAPRVRRDGQGPLRPDHQPHRAPRGVGDHRRRVPAPLRRRRAVGAPGHRRSRATTAARPTWTRAGPASACACSPSWRSASSPSPSRARGCWPRRWPGPARARRRGPAARAPPRPRAPTPPARGASDRWRWPAPR